MVICEGDTIEIFFQEEETKKKTKFKGVVLCAKIIYISPFHYVYFGAIVFNKETKKTIAIPLKHIDYLSFIRLDFSRRFLHEFLPNIISKEQTCRFISNKKSRQWSFVICENKCLLTEKKEKNNIDLDLICRRPEKYYDFYHIPPKTG